MANNGNREQGREGSTASDRPLVSLGSENFENYHEKGNESKFDLFQILTITAIIILFILNIVLYCLWGTQSYTVS